MKLLSTGTHGILDYATAGTLLALPRAMGWGRGTTRLLTGAALGTLAYSLLTRYELGAVKLLPMRAHLALDVAGGAMLAAAPMLLRDEDPGVAAAVMGLGFFEIAAALATEPEPAHPGAGLGPEDAETVALSTREVMRSGAVGG